MLNFDEYVLFLSILIDDSNNNNDWRLLDCLIESTLTNISCTNE